MPSHQRNTLPVPPPIKNGAKKLKHGRFLLFDVRECQV
ncbi:Uncharacterised protein [Klebsiella pneumoniae]|uniref:Uncharacterized protein n=1 Tax=Klebsiella pneumoniae TaxID=573 RepID=A0A377UZ70_KLEPN|nr:Uncharacterised protein [Klebsiella pneumoniae]